MARTYTVDASACIRCASCAILAPGQFEVSRRGSRLIRQPDSAADEAGCAAAALVCPTGAIHQADAPPAESPDVDHLIRDALHTRLYDQAERVRWRLDEIPWARIDRERATPGLRRLVREIAFSELTTYSATRRFLTEFADDVDFTQWISVWFYEETKHPQALLQWLAHLGDAVDNRFVLRGRATAPFMKSRMGTLVTNIISEMVASSAYAALHRRSPEPVLGLIGRNLAADEARHAASFYAYAARHLERSTNRDADRRDALKVLYLWFQGNDLVRHPVNEFYGRNQGKEEMGETMSTLGFDMTVPRDRIVRLVGQLVGLSLDQDSNLLAQVAALGRTGEPRGAGANPADAPRD